MEKETPMKIKPSVNATCKLGQKGCYDDGRCHALGNCENKIVTNADRIRAMSEEELAEWIYSLNHYFDNHRNVLSIGGITMEDCITDISEWLKREVEH